MSLRLSSLNVAAFAFAVTATLAHASDSKQPAAPAGAVDQRGQAATAPASPDLDRPVSTTLRKINRMLTSAYNKGYAAGLDAAAQAEGSQNDIRDLVKQATPGQKP